MYHLCKLFRLFFSSPQNMAQTTFTFDEARVINTSPLAVIMEGMFGNRHIAVKKMAVQHVDLAKNEIRLLEQRDEHPNIVRYFGFQMDRTFIYLALELCTGSLNEYVHSPTYRTAIPPREVCIKIGDGLNYLHELNIVHRNLKPSNVLFRAVNDDLIMIKISDYSISKIMEDTESFTSSATVGSISWAAPEMLGSGQRKTVKVDIYSLGWVYIFVLTNGRVLGRDLENLNSIQNGAQNQLITSMVSDRPEDRPSAAEILVHPAFWSATKSISFIRELSNIATAEFDFETYHNDVFSGSWTDDLPSTFVSRVSRPRGRDYDGNSLRDLIRMIRNVTAHRSDYIDLNNFIGTTPETLVDFFNARFPNLMYYAWLTGRPLQQELARFY